MTWNRNLWGVEFSFGPKDDEPMLLSQIWLETDMASRYQGEPTRALVFCARGQAREWCKKKNADLAHLGWRVKPVKVRELVEKS